MRSSLKAAMSISLLFVSTNVFAAEVVSLRNLQTSVRMSSVEAKKSVLRVRGLNNFVALKASNTSKEDYAKYQQTYGGLPVWGHQAIIANVNGRTRIHGFRVDGIENDVKTLEATFSAAQAQDFARERFISRTPFGIWQFSQQDVKKIIHVDAEKKAHLAYRVSFFADIAGGGRPTKPVFVVDAITKTVLAYHDSLMFEKARGPGGNEKIGKYYFGSEYPEIEVMSAGGNKCKMDSANVETVDMNSEDPDGVAGSGGMGGGGTGSTKTYAPFEFACGENTYKSVNGAYSPINDGHAFGNVVFNMYQDWYSLNPINSKLRVRIHYGQNFSNAFWDGKQMSFGDGGPADIQGTKIDLFHPLVSLDVMAHEVSHGFTQHNSNLEYWGEAGGMNEAFSDIAGEAAEYYFRGQNDFLVGYDIVKKDAMVNGQPFGQQAMREMKDQSVDGRSANHVSGFKWGMMCQLCTMLGDMAPLCLAMQQDSCMDPHMSSGIYNRAFYLLATTPGWNTKTAFDAFVRANQKYWSPTVNFVDGAKGVRDAAQDLGYDTKAVTNAFKEVGINI